VSVREGPSSKIPTNATKSIFEKQLF